MIAGRWRWTWLRRSAVALCCAACAGTAARAEVRVSAWLLVLHEADTRADAEAWATGRCAAPALATQCGEAWNDGALEARVGLYAAADWPGIDGDAWFVGVGPLRSRRAIRALQTTLDDAGLAATLHRIAALPRVQPWAAGELDTWRLWTLRGPATQQEVLYLSRAGTPDLELARGWPLPRAAGDAELYAIGPDPTGGAFYFFHSAAPQRLDVATGSVERAPDAPDDRIAAVRAAALAHLGDEAGLHVLWALPFAAGVVQDMREGDSGLRRRFLMRRRAEDGWTVAAEEVQVRSPVEPPEELPDD